jgi:hypothetical protein
LLRHVAAKSFAADASARHAGKQSLQLDHPLQRGKGDGLRAVCGAELAGGRRRFAW